MSKANLDTTRRPAGPSVLVTDAGLGSSVAIIRSLGRSGWRVVAGGTDLGSPGFRSRYACERLVYPDPETEPGECAAALLRAVHDRRIDLVIPVTDAVILPLAERRSEFEAVCRVALPPQPALEAAADKLRTLELAERLAVPVPRTCLARTTKEALECAPELGWPVVLKPVVSRLYQERRIESFTVSYAENLARLAEQMRQFEGRCPVLLQECCRGAGHGVELLMDRGRPLAAFQHRRLREVPLTGGASALRESVPLDPVLYGYAVRLLEALEWTGLAMVEFKVGEDGPRLMEINGRIWGSLPLAVRCGMDFPARLAALYADAPTEAGAEPAMSYRTGIRARNLKLDLVWIAQVLLRRHRYPFLPAPGRGQGVRALMELLHPAIRTDMFSLEDPRPALGELRAILADFRAHMPVWREAHPA
jgi:predicted ATP-grasp superfamily ATP-dependent carboligase